ncbi:MAG: AAC(3) family N-acetyltransferase [Planctomycetota bacterium]|nr:AAC(3) family N-acetyltransferase [Planctomycetota bacterium]
MTTSKPTVSQSNIAAGLAAVGLRAGDAVLVHSSLRSFGHVEGGADSVIDALLETVGAAGTVVVPTFTWDTFHDKVEGVFDVRESPSETGRITEVFRRRPGALRGTHVCHSLAAIGPHAADMVRDVPSCYGPGSGFEALHHLNAWNLFLGVGFTSCTALHAAEERMRVPYRQHRDFRGCTVVHADGHAAPSIAVEFLRKPGFFNDLGKMKAVLASHGLLRTTAVGNATITNVRIRDVMDITTRHLAEDIFFLLGADCRPK